MFESKSVGDRIENFHSFFFLSSSYFYSIKRLWIHASNECQQFIFWNNNKKTHPNKNTKNVYTPVTSGLLYIKEGFKGVFNL